MFQWRKKSLRQWVIQKMLEFRCVLRGHFIFASKRNSNGLKEVTCSVCRKTWRFGDYLKLKRGLFRKTAERSFIKEV